ncbi:MAG: hypothetical protein Q8927_12035 [Bacteroidota bacterium]|nr:hypothetical protein [Bacteroidota bacterium]MDP4216921.1 hypothetical protein [Bacteroidota bacterium]MDP4244886.1 hypothetical protein [Bacteroidota bacterium]MDP4255472.1 hypothetical protein [Bacteroidota bacterium]MDP4257113.1 hypothetical protein [Bacteroidota bacterium]
MIKFHELKQGDIVSADYEGQRADGEVIELNGDDKEVCVRTEVQDFWYTCDQLYPISLDDDQLRKFHFERQDLPGGGVKYLKGPFRILLTGPGNFSSFEMWYREDRRHMAKPLYVHELQNHYYEMTKVHLEREPMVKAG